MPFYANKGYHPNLMVHQECDLTSAHACDFATDLDKLHRELKQHIADAHIVINIWPTPNVVWLQNSRLAAKHYVIKMQFFSMAQL